MDNGAWKERGTGSLHLNVHKKDRSARLGKPQHNLSAAALPIDIHQFTFSSYEGRRRPASYLEHALICGHETGVDRSLCEVRYRGGRKNSQYCHQGRSTFYLFVHIPDRTIILYRHGMRMKRQGFSRRCSATSRRRTSRRLRHRHRLL